MPLTYPLSAATFMDLLPISEMTFELSEQLQVSRTAGGAQISADLGDRLWTGTVSLGRMTRAEAMTIEVLIDQLRQAGRSFLAYDPRRPAPFADPAGATLGAATPQIAALDTDARLLGLKGLPAAYQLSPGDMLAFSYGSPTARQALHRVVSPVIADGSGITPLFEVMPAIRTGAAVDAAVALVKPACRAVLQAGATTIGRTRRTITEGTAFTFVQTLR